MRRSAVPATPLILSSSWLAQARLPARSFPTIWMSSGAGNPKFKIWVTMSTGNS